jgi:type 1 fimbria pilin
MKKIASLALALLLTGWAGGAFAAEKAKTMVAQGKVTAATNQSLTIEQGSQTLTFTVDGSTKLYGKGLSTMMREKKAKNESFAFTDGVTVDDLVKVVYHDVDGKMHAAQVTVVQKSLAKK